MLAKVLYNTLRFAHQLIRFDCSLVFAGYKGVLAAVSQLGVYFRFGLDVRTVRGIGAYVSIVLGKYSLHPFKAFELWIFLD